MSIVSRYDSIGFFEDLSSLNEGRFSHGCGVYYDDGEQVRVIGQGGSVTVCQVTSLDRKQF